METLRRKAIGSKRLSSNRMTASYLNQSPHYGRSTVWTTIHAVLRPFLTVWAQKKGSDRKMKRTRISVLLVIALLLQLYAPLTAGAADFTPNPQTEYAKRFIAACDGQTHGSSTRSSVC